MKNSLIYLTIILFAVSCNSNSGKQEKENWIQLFNGKDLEGWDIKITGHELNDNYMNIFRVEDGIMKVRYEGIDSFRGEFGHIFYKDPFSRYKLRIEYRFVGDQVPGGHPGRSGTAV